MGTWYLGKCSLVDHVETKTCYLGKCLLVDHLETETRHLKTIKIKQDYPDIKKAYFRKDNAGCYHSNETIKSCSAISQSTGSISFVLTLAILKVAKAQPTD